MFSPAGPKPWHTKPGHSRLDALIEQAREKQTTVEEVLQSRSRSVDHAQKAEVSEKMHEALERKIEEQEHAYTKAP